MTRMVPGILALLLLTCSAQSLAVETHYDANIKGMVCAFCAYNVSKQIEALPGVERGSVGVNLDSGQVHFSTHAEVDEKQLSAAITEAGFTLESLRVVDSASPQQSGPNPVQRLALEFDASETQRFESLLDAIGAIAAKQGGQLRIQAPAALEIELLKPLLAGRQRAIPVTFDAHEGSAVAVHLMQIASGHGRGPTTSD